MAKDLVIVESPTKAKTISKFLGKNYIVESSYGHIRDLPKKKLGVDIEHNFEPEYDIPEKSKKQIDKLKKAAKNAEHIYLATDPDREGEAISWHLCHILNIEPEDAKRIVFHEITKKAIEEALTKPQPLDINLVNAQQARRVLDRLVGYKLSPFLWKKVTRGLSAGRVQSVAVRLIVEREREIEKFNPEEYWTINALLSSESGVKNLESSLYKKDNKVIKKFDINTEKLAKEITNKAQEYNYSLTSVAKKEKKKKPPTPFTTSTLQQASNNKLGFSTKQTMKIAQELYEGIEIGTHGTVGLITYMRTDSLFLSKSFVSDAKKYILENFDDKHYPEKPRFYKTKSKSAQEAHEAIRPTHVHFDPQMIKPYLSPRQFKLYNLIWSRSIASQMADALTMSTTLLFESEKKEFTFKTNGSVITFPSFLEIYQTDSKEKILPEITEGEKVSIDSITPDQHFTQPPARYNEASLVKALEEHGIGRPSTYSPTISTIQDRNYVTKEDKKLKPTDIAYVVNDVLVDHFKNIVDFEFTAQMEDKLDAVAHDKHKWNDIIEEFYTPFAENLIHKEKELSKKDITEEKTDIACDKCKNHMVIKIGRFGKFLACSNYPDCKNTAPVPGSDEEKQLKEQENQKTDEVCEKCDNPMVIKTGRYGQFLGCSNYPDCKNIKSITKSTGVSCPECKKGELVEKNTKRRKIFYGCSSYPDCTFALWQKPTNENCPECSSILTFGAKNTLKCSNKECKFKKEQSE